MLTVCLADPGGSLSPQDHVLSIKCRFKNPFFFFFSFYKIFLQRTNQLQTFKKSTRDTDGANVSLISWLAGGDKNLLAADVISSGKIREEYISPQLCKSTCHIITAQRHDRHCKQPLCVNTSDTT